MFVEFYLFRSFFDETKGLVGFLAAVAVHEKRSIASALSNRYEMMQMKMKLAVECNSPI